MRIRSHETTLREVTVSIGVAMYPESGGTLEELLRAADRALYAAKHRGRNQIVLADTAVAV
jgi:diguanylate cyclase (GGDEF)-like protein